jgi:hypothetical protein
MSKLIVFMLFILTVHVTCVYGQEAGTEHKYSFYISYGF